MKFRPRQDVTIEAVKFDPPAEIPPGARFKDMVIFKDQNGAPYVMCPTLHGEVKAERGDWIVVKENEKYPIKDAELHRKYEPVPAPTTTSGS